MAAFLLPGCESTGNKSGIAVGPQVSSLFDSDEKAVVDPSKPRLDVVIPVFDPGLSDDAENYAEEGVWPELRRAEANRFAYKMKEALEDTGAFGAVRVVPDGTATGDLYVLGQIVESNGEDVEITVEVLDITGERWFTRSFDHEVEPGFHKNIRNEGKDPYDPVFDEAANRIAQELEDYESAELDRLKQTTELRFGSSFTQEAFSDHLVTKNGRAELTSFPSENDPMLQRTRAIRVRDQLFVDNLQETYRTFSDDMETSYLIWQEQSLQEVLAQREVEREATTEAMLGILSIGVAIAAIAAGANSDSASTRTAAVTGGVVAGAAGALLLKESFQTSEEAKVHRDALAELGESIDVELAPRVVAFQEQTVELTGTAREQFAQWRKFLKKIYMEERTPEVQL
ncbi:hypothetical protein FKG95_20710 [Denitrobaculum tricleocarpae]|uniref:Uncharacterized protein n=2 Tax=Denitrobaculum tricleocarpae TaxID=2591009 RepID=A0A545TLA9_9PROT|nr:hypothetical protein FKG95_20710 [Denitrobaculum tricleocarpae]